MTVGGARADAFQYKSGVRFPESVSVATSQDGKTFTEQSRDKHKTAKYAHNGWPANWPLHPFHDSPNRGVFPDYGLLGNYIFLPFKAPVKARYVRFTVTAQKGAAFQLSEVHVWDYLKVEPWTPRLAHQAPSTN